MKGLNDPRLAAIINDSDDAIFATDPAGLVTSWNRSAERIFGYRADELLGQPATVLLPPEILANERTITARILAGERVSHYETVRLRKDGTCIEVSLSASAIRDPSSAIIGVSAIARDITERNNFRRELERAKESAEAANRELEAFSYSVAHDLRAPLRSIDGFSQALLEDYGATLDATAQRYLGFVRTSAQLMAQLIDDLLMLSRVTRSELAREPVDLSALARATVARIVPPSPTRQVTWLIADGLVVDGDARLLGTALFNLLANAWKFTSGCPEAHIELGRRETEGNRGQRVLFVRDNGAGFDMAYASKLFGVFQRLHSSTEFEGTGVGLAIVQRVVHRHGGRIWAEAAPGQGATFFFTLD